VSFVIAVMAIFITIEVYFRKTPSTLASKVRGY
jgi:hypothetical protein